MPALGTRSFFDVTLRDATGEPTTTRFFGTPLTALDFSVQVGLQGALEAAIDDITLGEIAKDQFGVSNTISNAIPTDPTAQREMKLLVQMQGVTSEQPFTFTVGTIDPSVLAFIPGGGDAVPLDASAEIIAFVSAVNGYVKNPNNTAEAAEVVGLRFVGRNT